MPETVEILCLANDFETVALKSALDCWGYTTRLHLIGRTSEVVEVLGGAAEGRHLIISAHGEKNRFLTPKLAASVRPKEKYNKGYFDAAGLKEILCLRGQIVFCNACTSGKLAKVFINGGAAAFIAPCGYPEGDDSLAFALNFYYRMRPRQKYVPDVTKAFLAVPQTQVAKREQFELFV